MTTWSLAQLRDLFPTIPWDEPLPVHLFEGPVFYGCRVCMANRGIGQDKSAAVEGGILHETMAGCAEHVRGHL